MKHYQEQLGPSTQQMRRANKIKPKTRCSDGWTPSDDNGPVAFGKAFKKLDKKIDERAI